MNFNLIPLTTDRVDDLVKLASPHLGEGYLDREYFFNSVTSNNYDGWCVVDEKNELVAFLIYYKTGEKEVVNKVGDRGIKEFLDSKIICLDTMVVAPKYRKMGVGKWLIEQAIKRLQKEYGFLMYAWNQRGKINMEKIANSFAFKLLGEYKELWKSDCENNLFKCPAKKSGIEACVCSTVLYYKAKELF